jgi:hypothetical protein
VPTRFRIIINVTPEEYDIVQKKATDIGEPMSTLCKHWIMEKILGKL